MRWRARRLLGVTSTLGPVVPRPATPQDPAPTIRVLLADAHPVVRRVLADLLAETGDIAVVGECESGSELVEAAVRSRPDVVLVDPGLPGADPLEAVRQLLGARPQTRVVVHAAGFSLVTSARAQRLGAVGYLLKCDDLGDLPRRVREVAAGGTAWGGTHPVA
jgi:DNA-binding NarL/FixJ family response regulator